jgi:hypothetical protein
MIMAMVLFSRLGVRRHQALLILAVLVGALLPALLAGLTGNLSIPHNDAWSYSRIAQTFAQTGQIKLLNWNRSALIGQFLPLGPLASSLVVQQLFVALLAVVMLLAAYDLLAPVTGRDRAALATLVFSLWPGLGLLSTSFMLDVPALAATLGALALARRAQARGSVLLLGLALLVAFWGFTIRAQAIAAPVAIGLTVLAGWRRDRRLRPLPVIGLFVAFAVVAGVFQLWQGTLANNDAPVFSGISDPLRLTLQLCVTAYFLLALALSPAVLFVVRPRTWRPASWVAAATAAVVGIVELRHMNTATVFPAGNYLSPHGAYYGVVYAGSERAVLSPVTWDLILAFSGVAGVLLAGVLVQRWRSLDLLTGSFVVITFVGTVATGLTGQQVYDRYWMALAPGILAVILVRPAQLDPSPSPDLSPDPSPQPDPQADSRPGLRLRPDAQSETLAVSRFAPRHLAVGATVLVLAVLSFALTANGLAFDRARWNAAQGLVAAGVPARDVDAGLEWIGDNSAHGVEERYPTSALIPDFSEMFPSDPPCYVTVPAPLTRQGWKLREILDYRTFLAAGTSKLYVYSTSLPGCGTQIF